MPRLSFRSSRPPAARRKRSAFSAARPVAATLTLAGLGVFLLPVFRSTLPAALERRFTAHREAFAQLRDMVSEEPVLEAVGVDNVGDYWLFDGRWTNSQNRFAAVSLEQMLRETGLAPDRYQSYLGLLDRVGAYRVSRSGPAGRRAVRIWLYPAADEARSAAPRIFHSRRVPEPVTGMEEARRSAGPSYVGLGGEWYVEFRRR